MTGSGGPGSWVTGSEVSVDAASGKVEVVVNSEDEPPAGAVVEPESPDGSVSTLLAPDSGFSVSLDEAVSTFTGPDDPPASGG
jgi:hypothetical protein